MTAYKPTPQQLRFLDWEFGIFFHFGIRSFFPGHVDWDKKPMPLSAFNPMSLDCDQWITTIKRAGAAYAVFTTKHHDGFALWPTAYTDYSVSNTPWQGGKGDVVREFVEACRRHDLGVGLYYSPAQWGDGPAFQEGKAYDDYFVAQVTELLSNYGRIDYLWFDGAGSDGHRYDKARIVSAIRALQPDILLFNLWDPDTLWAGNEEGYTGLDNHNLRRGLKADHSLTDHDQPEAVRFLPLECDCRLRDNWFWGPEDKRIKSTQQLIGMWEHSVGRGANLLLNIGPDNRGLIPEEDSQRLLELAAALEARYGTSLPFRTAHAQQALTMHNVEGHLIDRVMLSEDMTDGQQVRSFQLHARMPHGLPPVLLYQGLSLGHKALCVFPPIYAEGLELTTDPPEAVQKVSVLGAYLVKP